MLMLCQVAFSQKKQRWEHRRIQEQMQDQAVGSQNYLLCPRSHSRAPGCDFDSHPSLVPAAQDSSSCSAVHTSFQLLASHRLGTGTTTTFIGVARQESTSRGLLGSLHNPLTPSSHSWCLSCGLQIQLLVFVSVLLAGAFTELSTKW